jgi:hypothetical protein
MTEAEWLACRDLRRMVRALDPRQYDRKLRLFACACCRGVWHLLTDEKRRALVETSERYADGEATYYELRAALTPPGAFRWSSPAASAADSAAVCAAALHLASYVASADSYLRAALHAAAALAAARHDGPAAWALAGAAPADTAAQRALLVEIVGNPFRPTQLRPSWLLGADGGVRPFARAIDRERAFERLPILADALEDACCADADLLAHLRGSGPHVRGCWALDVVLGLSVPPPAHFGPVQAPPALPLGGPPAAFGGPLVG